MVHRNFEQTEEMVNNLLEMNSKVAALEEMLAADSQELIGPAPNLLLMHFQINRFEGFRNQTMHQAKKASNASRQKLIRIFERLSKLIEDFEFYILELARNILPIVRAGYPEVVVKLVKIVELEGRADEKVCASESSVHVLLNRPRPLLFVSSKKLPKWMQLRNSNRCRLMRVS